MSKSIQAIIVNYHRWAVLNNKYLFLAVLEARKTTIKGVCKSYVHQGPTFCFLHIILLCPHMVEEVKETNG